MAKVKSPQGLTGLRHRVGAYIYNSYGQGTDATTFRNTVSARHRPAHVDTAAKKLICAQTNAVTKTWSALSVAQRTAWATYAATFPDLDWLGNPKQLSGFNFYVQANARAAHVGDSPITDPPLTGIPGNASSAGFAFSGGEWILAYTRPAANAYWIETYDTTDGQNPRPGRLQKAHRIDRGVFVSVYSVHLGNPTGWHTYWYSTLDTINRRSVWLYITKQF